ncbi:MAG: hypothetical protein ACRD3W_21140 [Terriglobales bacterium]
MKSFYLYCCLSIIACALAIVRVDANSRGIGNHTTVSANQQYSFESIPDLIAIRTGSYPAATKGVFSKQNSTGDYSKVWSISLMNDPERVLVPNDGRYVIVLGDAKRSPENFVVIYGDNGRLVRSFSLDTLLRETHSVRPPFFGPQERLVYYDGRGVGGGNIEGCIWIDAPRIDESNHCLSFWLHATTVPDFQKFVRATNWKDGWEKKEISIQLRTGRIL